MITRDDVAKLCEMAKALTDMASRFSLELDRQDGLITRESVEPHVVVGDFALQKIVKVVVGVVRPYWPSNASSYAPLPAGQQYFAVMGNLVVAESVVKETQLFHNNKNIRRVKYIRVEDDGKETVLIDRVEHI